MSESGLVVIDKPTGITSHDVVARVRRAMGTRKVGHAGTLDPMATGVLVIGIEKATRLLGHLSLRDKEYIATVRLGASTVSDDSDGEIVAVADPSALQELADEQVQAAFADLVGTIQQRPSAVSAIKVDGRRAYDRVRAGEDVELAPRTVVVSSIDVSGVRREEGFLDVDIRVECSTGTYIRALARDAGAVLGIGGHLTSLRRTRVGPFGIERAIGVDEVSPASIVGMNDVARMCFPVWAVSDDAAESVQHGRRIPYAGGPDVPVAVLDGDGRFLALAEDDDGAVRYLAVFA